MGSKFNSLFGSYSKMYDQASYRSKEVSPTRGQVTETVYKDFSSEEGRNTIMNCPFGFNYQFMNPREFQRFVLFVNYNNTFLYSDGDWWMDSDPSITFNKQKMFNMFDAASLETYFGSKNINPYLKNDPKTLLKNKEHHLINPSLFAHCIDQFVGTPVQDETGSEAENFIIP